MAAFNDAWKVPEHGPVEEVAPGILTVAGELSLALGRFPRRMTAVRLSAGRAAIWSAMPLDEAGMARIEALGRPAVLIVPGMAHRLDARAWLKRYPTMKVLCPPGAVAKVEQAVAVDDTSGAVLQDADTQFRVVSGTGLDEAALLVRRGRDLTLVLNDVLANVRNPRGMGANAMARLMGFGVARPEVPWLGRRMLIEDELAFAGCLQRWAGERDLKRIIVSHGDVITRNPREELARIARGFL